MAEDGKGGRNGTVQNGVKKFLYIMITVLAGALLTYGGIFITYNYAQDAKRAEKIEKLSDCVNKCKEDAATRQAVMEGIKNDIYDTKRAVDEIKKEQIAIGKDVVKILSRLPR